MQGAIEVKEVGWLQLTADNATRHRSIPVIIDDLRRTVRLVHQAALSKDGCAPGFEYQDERHARLGNLLLQSVGLATRAHRGSAQEERIFRALSHWKHEPRMEESWIVNRASILCIAVRCFGRLYAFNQVHPRLPHQSCLVLTAVVKVLSCEPLHIENLEQAIRDGVVGVP